MKYIAVGPGYFPDGDYLIFSGANKEILEAQGYKSIPFPDIGQVEAFKMKLALEQLIHLHSCEQEGMTEGLPTLEQWEKALDAAQNAVNLD